MSEEHKTMIEIFRNAIPEETQEITVAIPLSEYEELVKAKAKVEVFESLIGKIENIYFKE